MKDKEKLFAVLRSAVESPRESAIVEEFIQKIDHIMPPIETIDDTQTASYTVRTAKSVVTPRKSLCTARCGITLTEKFRPAATSTTSILIKTTTIFQT